MLRIMLCQQQPKTGAIEENTVLVIRQIEKAKLLGVGLVVFPELFLSGYPPEDLLFRSAMAEKIETAFQLLAQASQEVALLIGSPYYEQGRLYNTIVLFSYGVLQQRHDKKNLPSDSVFDEHRYFTPGKKDTVIEVAGFSFMLSVCEELWAEGMAKRIQASQADMVVSINGSPFYQDKQQERINRIKQLCTETETAMSYLNLSSYQDELVFDGGSCVVDAKGELVAEARQFTTDAIIVDLDKQQQITLQSNRKAKTFCSKEQQTFLALTTSLRSYVDNNGFKGVLVGVSGGIDSAVVLAIACAALGSQRVRAVMMPYRYTSSASTEDARQLANNLAVDYQEISIEQMVDTVQATLPCDQSTEEWQLTLQNIQARSRGLLLMALSNYSKHMVLATGNKSEMAVGYATLYGDMVGGFAPLKDVDKTGVYRLAHYCNQAVERIPSRIITREPSAELLLDQKDSDNLPEYSMLDPVLHSYIEKSSSYQELLPLAPKDSLSQVLSMVDRNEHKRRQAAIGTKVTKVAFGKDRRMPITQGWKHGYE